jgi:hypothetical protein
VLLEVVLALVLFAAAATIIGAGLNASLDGLERLRLNTHAANLAVSVVSELQMGIKTAGVEGAQPFLAPYEGWTWEVSAGPAGAGQSDSSRLRKVEVAIRHGEPPIVYRLSQMLLLQASKPSKELSASEPPPPPRHERGVYAASTADTLSSGNTGNTANIPARP